MEIVTCLCITKNRRQWLPRAIAYYQAQSYPRRELLIVADGESVVDLIPHDPSIRLIHEAGNIGTKRNLGCQEARGSIVLHWDDDDRSAPERIADQVARLEASGKAVTGYWSMLFTDGRQWWEYRRAKDYVLGTSLAYLQSWWKAHPFENVPLGEDSAFVGIAAKHKQLVAAEAGGMMVATIHRGNTSKRRMNCYWRSVAPIAQ